MLRAPSIKTAVDQTDVLPYFAPRDNHQAYASELRRASFARRLKDGLPSVARRSFHPQLFERRMVEVNGIEPMASWLQTRRSPN